MPSAKPKIAFWFRYGPAEHTELWHALPLLIEKLSAQCDVHYFGLQSDRPTPLGIAQHATLHLLPFKVDRTSHKDKIVKTLIWYLCLPCIGLRCRVMGVDMVYVDETLPLLALIARIFFGGKIAMTIADFFVDVYMQNNCFLRPIASLVKRMDYASWRRLSLIFTKTEHTINFLEEKGIPRSIMHVVYDPCDTKLYHPMDKQQCRRKFGYTDDNIVLVHHGVLHPNKGNDRVLRAIAELRHELPQLRFLLVGSGPEEARLRDLTIALQVQDIVTLTGWLEKPTDVCTALNAADIGLVMRVGHESDDFHVTGTLVHNMACGLPILAANLAGVRELVSQGKEGFIFEPETMSGFADALNTLSRDPTLRCKMAEASLTASQQFDMKTVVDATIAALVGTRTNPTGPA